MICTSTLSKGRVSVKAKTTTNKPSLLRLLPVTLTSVNTHNNSDLSISRYSTRHKFRLPLSLSNSSSSPGELEATKMEMSILTSKTIP